MYGVATFSFMHEVSRPSSLQEKQGGCGGPETNTRYRRYFEPSNGDLPLRLKFLFVPQISKPPAGELSVVTSGESREMSLVMPVAD